MAIEAAPSSVSGRSRSQTPLTALSEDTTPSAQHVPKHLFNAETGTASPEFKRMATTTDGCVSVGFSFLVRSAYDCTRTSPVGPRNPRDFSITVCGEKALGGTPANMGAYKATSRSIARIKTHLAQRAE